MKRMWIVLLVVALLLSGCGNKADTEQTLFCMDTAMQLQFWGKDSNTASQQVQALLLALETEWSPAGEGSVIPYLEMYGQELGEPEYVEDPVTGVVMEVPGAGAAYDFTPQQVEVIEKALALSIRTEGAFDPQLGALMELWGFTTGGYQVPTKEMAADAAQYSRWDLGGAIKGYAGDRAVELLQELNVESALLNLGGNIQTYGSKSNGKPWRIGVQDPDDSSKTVCTLEVEGTMSVVTSGSYQRYFEQDGVTYHHIMDPQTGYPVQNGILSVTVIAKDGMTADCLSTALFVMGYEKAVKHWQQSDDFEMVMVMDDGKVFATDGVKLYKSDCEVIKR